VLFCVIYKKKEFMSSRTDIKSRQPNAEVLREKQKAKRAWAEFYHMRDLYYDQRMSMYQRFTTLTTHIDEKKDCLPKHLVNEFIEMSQELKREISCCVCLEMVTKDTQHMTRCGHMLDKTCFEKVKDSENKCPMCRAQLVFVKQGR